MTRRKHDKQGELALGNKALDCSRTQRARLPAPPPTLGGRPQVASPQVREAEKLPSREDVARASISFLTSHQLTIKSQFMSLAWHVGGQGA